MTTKAYIIADAYSQLRISGLTTDPTPEDLAVALARLENMMAEINLNIPYNFQDTPDPADLLNVDREYWHGMATNLAARLVPDFNKPMSMGMQSLQAQARQSLARMASLSANPRQIDYPTRQARGSGNTQRFNPWYRYFRPVPKAPNEPQTNRMAKGDVNDYVENFDSYLNSGEDVTSYTIQADQGLTILSDSLGTPNVNYRIRADGSPTAEDGWLRVIITATTTQSRVETRQANFMIFDVSI